MKPAIKILLLHISVCCVLFSQDTDIVKYFPLKVGNVWVYSGSYSSIQCMSSYYQKLYIDSIKTFNNKLYYKFNYSIRFRGANTNCSHSILYDGYYRIDSVSGNIYRYRIDTNCTYSPLESLVDSLFSNPWDTAKICSGTQFFLKIARDTNSWNIFQISKPTKCFEGGNFHEYGFFTRYAKDFGIIEFSQFGMSMSSQSFLKGCVLNGIMYGDTNFYYVGIQQVPNEIPGLYKLSQNYPNPFNPETRISFDIPKSSFVLLNIYDAAGKEIDKLVNEELAPGIYSVSWDATSYPSGVYFYKVQADAYTETRKMVLIK